MALAEHAIFQYWSDNLARTGTLSVETGTPDSSYPASLLVDDRPGKVAKIASTTGAFMVDHGEAVDVQLGAAIHHTFDAGDTNVRLQRNDDPDDWSSPSIDAPLIIPDWLGSGPSLWPVNPWVDLTQEAGYNPTGFRYSRVVCTGNSQNIQVGQLWLGGAIRRWDPDVRWGVGRDVGIKTSEPTLTALDVEDLYAYDSPIWAQDGEILTRTDAEAEVLRAHFHEVGGRSRVWLLIPDGAVNACYLVRWSMSKLRFVWASPGIRSFPISVREVARGLRPGV